MPHLTSIRKALLLLTAATLIFFSFWLSRQSPGYGAPELVRVESSGLVAGLHPLDELLIRYPREGRGLSGFYLEGARKSLPAFEIDACEVNQGDYGRFVQWHQQLLAVRAPHTMRDPWWNPEGIEEPADWLSRTRDHKFLGRNDVPATGVLPGAARTYCLHMGGDLPTELQWEAAASGQDQRLYPWGNEPSATKRLFHDPILNIARACGSEPDLSTPGNIMDMGNGASNLALAISDNPFAHNKVEFAIKGGSWRQPDAIHALNFLRAPADKDIRSNHIGFRCAYRRHFVGHHQGGRRLSSPWHSQATTRTIPGGSYWLGQPQGSVLLDLGESINSSQYLVLLRQAEEASDSPSQMLITRAEVTVAQYQRFLNNLVARLGFYDHPVQPAAHQHTPMGWAQQLASPEMPVRGVNWWSATAYGSWLGGRLLSEQEWMLLAGGLNRQYPDTSDTGVGVLRDPRFMQHVRDALDEGNDLSESGLLAMGGNVMEWTRTIVPGSSLNFVLKGGSYRTPPESSKLSNTSVAPPEYSSMDLGFRVIFPEPPSWHDQRAEPKNAPDEDVDEGDGQQPPNRS